jgi:hypothetical protein
VEEGQKETKIEAKTPEETQEEQQMEPQPEASAEQATETMGVGATSQPTVEGERAAMEGKEESPEAQKLKEQAKESAEEVKTGILEDTYKEVKEVFNYEQLKDTLNSLAHESTVRRVKIKNREGRTVMDVPMWLAAAGGAGAIIWVPGLSIIGLIVSVARGVTIEVERVSEKQGQ